MRKPSVGIIFLTVFIDLVGFGIVIPLLQVFGKKFEAGSLELGALLATFSLMQFIFAPILGRLSDRIGRRPVLLLSTAGAAISYAIFAMGSAHHGQAALALLFASRAFAGICGGNIGVAQAYIADITPASGRSRGMGLIGMAFGLGFVLGPAIGAYAIRHFGITGPGWIAASLCAVNFFLALTILPESWKPGAEQAARRPHLAQWLHTLRQPTVGLLTKVFFLATFCFTCFETTIGLLIIAKFGLNEDDPYTYEVQSRLFVYAGLIGALTQGGATGRLVKMFGEPKLISISLIVVGIGIGLLPYANGWAGILVTLGLLSIGASLTRPPVFGMISNLTPSHEQGATIGVTQGMGALARIVGPLLLVPLFYQHAAIPYVLCGIISILTGLLVWLRLTKGYVQHPPTSVPLIEA